MIALSLSQIAPLLEAEMFGGDASFGSVSSDTRTLTPGDLFVALQGTNFDGHDYLETARERGAVAVLVSRAISGGLPGLRVRDTKIALGRLAAFWRQHSAAPLIGVTGSNGKTTVKEMIAATLGRRGSVLATRGNYNNDIGLPLTLLRLQEQAFAVVEMGANNPGEIEYLSRIAAPDVALITNAGRAHLAGFGTLEGVARAKSEILTGLKPDGWFVLNADDPSADFWREQAGTHRTISFGVERPADVSSPKEALELHWSASGFVSRFPVFLSGSKVEIALALAGDHNRMNALAAIAVAQVLGTSRDDIQIGLAAMKPVPGRLQSLPGRNGASVINDSYNANPDSVKAAINLLASAPGRRWLVLGELAEMGATGAELYRELGDYARQSGIDRIAALGAAGQVATACGARGEHFHSIRELTDRLLAESQPGDWILIKGSRAARMERVVEALSAEEAV